MNNTYSIVQKPQLRKILIKIIIITLLLLFCIKCSDFGDYEVFAVGVTLPGSRVI
jgi:hypothetical protein